MNCSLNALSYKPIFNYGAASEPSIATASLNNEDRHLNTCAAFYFNNLRENFGTNIHNSCGFVALGSLLSFCDSYWDDSIVSDKFEKNEIIPSKYVNLSGLYNSKEYSESPGIIDDSTAMKELSTSSSQSQIYQNAENNNLLQFYLIKEFYEYINNSYYDKFYSKLDFTVRDSYLNKYLNHYLNEAFGSGTETYTKFVTGASTITDSLISEIKNGKPAIVLLNNNLDGQNYKGHFAVAYDYDSSASNEEDGIIFHTGWDGGYAVSYADMKSLGYTNISSYSIIDEDIDSFSHSCSNNYLSSSNSFCLCTLSIHPAHIHSKEDAFIDDVGNDSFHVFICNTCSTLLFQSHTNTKKVVDGWLCNYCKKCGHIARI